MIQLKICWLGIKQQSLNDTVFVCPKLGPGYSANVVGFFYVQWFRWEVVICFVDIEGIVDYHCLKFLFIMYTSKPLVEG